MIIINGFLDILANKKGLCIKKIAQCKKYNYLRSGWINIKMVFSCKDICYNYFQNKSIILKENR